MTGTIDARRFCQVLATMAQEQLPADASIDFQVVVIRQILNDENRMAELWRRICETTPPTEGEA